MTDTVLPVTSPDDMVAVLQRRCAQLIAGLQKGVHPQQIKDHIVSMYRVSEVLLEAFNKLEAELNHPDPQEASGEEQRH